MKRSTRWLAAVTMALCITGTSFEAAAWGPRSQQAVAISAMRLVKTKFPEAFGTGETKFDQDVLRGSQDGLNRLRQWYAINSPDQAMDAVDSEIQLLRRARQLGLDSYFEFRLGVLGGLVADLALPASVAYAESDHARIDRMNGDLDLRVENLIFTPRTTPRIYVRSAKEYTREYRNNFRELDRIVHEDYATGDGYQGVLKNGQNKFYSNAIEAVADVWYTILRDEGDVGDIRTSDTALIEYLISKIDYTLNIKNNTGDAERAYTEFGELKPTALENYEAIGDIFYNYSDATRERGVREWERALEFPGKTRQRVVQKVGNHYLKVGEERLEEAQANARERDAILLAAVDAFTNTLKFDRTNDRAADLLTQTNNEIRERNANRQTQIEIIAGAESVMQKAEEMKKLEDFSGAIQAYNQAQGLLAAVSPDFPDQDESAKKRVGEIKKELNSINTGIIDKGNQLIAKGDRMVDSKKFDDAVNLYRQVQSIVEVVPETEKTHHGQAQELIKKAEDKVANAEKERKRYEEQQKALESAQPPK